MIFGNDAVEIRDGQPFCKQCGKAMSTITAHEPGLYPPQQSGRAYFCPTHGQFLAIEGVNEPTQV
jgi:hypothetical protein